SAKARQDLLHLFSYLAERNPAPAETIAQSIDRKFLHRWTGSNYHRSRDRWPDGCRRRTAAMTDLDGEIRAGRHVMPVRVYYEDTDFSGVVYHANYLRFMERGRTNYLRLIGVGHRAMFEEAQKEAPGFAFVVRSLQIEFLKPARMDDVLEVVTVPVDVKGASIMLRQQIMR